MANVWKLNKNGQSHKTIEWVKLIDYDYSQKEGQSMIKIDSKEVLWNGVWKVKDLGSRFLIWKHEDVCTIFISSFESNVWKGLGQNGWMDEDGV
jgi:hypothetical protein